jgi:hypothetical protein
VFWLLDVGRGTMRWQAANESVDVGARSLHTAHKLAANMGYNGRRDEEIAKSPSAASVAVIDRILMDVGETISASLTPSYQSYQRLNISEASPRFQPFTGIVVFSSHFVSLT